MSVEHVAGATTPDPRKALLAQLRDVVRWYLFVRSATRQRDLVCDIVYSRQVVDCKGADLNTRGAIAGLVAALVLTPVALATGASSASANGPDSGNQLAAGDHYHPHQLRTVSKTQQYHIAITAAQGGQTPIKMGDLTQVTNVTLKHLDPRAPAIVVTFDAQQGLRVSVPVGTTPDVYRLRVLGTGCFQNQCDLNFDAKLTATVTPPIVATPGVEQFTEPSVDRIEHAAPLPAGGAVLEDELVVTLGSPHAPGTLSDARRLATLVGARVTGGIESLGVFEFRWTAAVQLDAITTTLQQQPGVTGVSRTTVGLVQANALPPGDWNDDGPATTWPFTQIRAQQAWDVTTGGSSVAVGIVDGGAVFKGHEDLNVTTVLAGSAAQHATHVAGLACAKANGIGLVGVSWGCPIVSSGIGGGTDKEVLAAMYNVAKSGVRVVNASLGYGVSGRPNLCLTAPEAKTYNDLAQQNSKPFWQLFDGPTGKNIIWTFSAGNNCSQGPQSPWAATWPLPNVITVTATNASGQLSSFSDFGPGVEVAAPGGVGEGIAGGAAGVWSTWVKSCYVFFQCSDYHQDMGTSMAAPMVAGVAALAQSIDLKKPAADVASCIVNSAGTAVGSASGRSSQPQLSSRQPQATYDGEPIPIVNAEAAVLCARGDLGTGSTPANPTTTPPSPVATLPAAPPTSAPAAS